MNILMINGSPHANGNTAVGLAEMKKIFDAEGIETTILQVGDKAIRGCISCGTCTRTGKCTFDDEVNQAAALFEKADGLVIASPVYYASANGTLVSFLDRLFFSAQFDMTMKVGASIAVARRGGCTATFDQLNKFMGISQMPIITSYYWNMVHGNTPEEVLQDEEGIGTMRQLGRNMAFFLKCIEAGHEKGLQLESEPKPRTNFIR